MCQLFYYFIPDLTPSQQYNKNEVSWLQSNSIANTENSKPVNVCPFVTIYQADWSESC